MAASINIIFLKLHECIVIFVLTISHTDTDLITKVSKDVNISFINHKTHLNNSLDQPDLNLDLNNVNSNLSSRKFTTQKLDDHYAEDFQGVKSSSFHNALGNKTATSTNSVFNYTNLSKKQEKLDLERELAQLQSGTDVKRKVKMSTTVSKSSETYQVKANRFILSHFGLNKETIGKMKRSYEREMRSITNKMKNMWRNSGKNGNGEWDLSK